MAENIETDQIDGAKGGRLGPAHGWSGQRVYVFDGEVHFLHEAHDVQNRKCADAIADEVGRVFGEDHAFAETNVAEVRNGVEQRAVRVGRGDQFEQPHVAGRIEKMCAEPGPAEVVGESFGDFAHGQSAGVGGDDGAGLAHGFDLLQQSPLDVEVFHHGFDDPVDVGQLFEVVIEVADGDEAGERRFHEGGGLGFLRGIEASGGDLISFRTAHGSVRAGRNNIKQIAGNTGVGKMRGDAGAHRAGAEDSNFINAFHVRPR